MAGMSEKQWLKGNELPPLLTCLTDQFGVLRTVAGRRRARLFACACCRRVWPILDENSRQAVEVAERFADGAATKEGLCQAELGAAYAMLVGRGHLEWSAARAAREASRARARSALTAWYWAWGAQVRDPRTPGAVRQPQGQEVEQELCQLLRHIFGDPFAAPVTSSRPPAVVKRLAEALYAGEDCAGPLHDALLEAGMSEMADHFREGQHPKGCAWLDRLLGEG